MTRKPAPRRAPALAVGGGLIVLMAGGVGLLSGASGSHQRTSDPPTPINTSRAEVTAATPPAPVADRSSGPIAIDYEAVRRSDLVLVGDEDVVLVSFDGAERGRGKLNGWYPNGPDRGVDVEGTSGAWSLTEAPALDDPVPGCAAVHGAGGIRVAICGAEHEPGEVRLVTTDGRYRLLTGAVNPTGHWRYALPSPDGKWVLAQWSGECEVPTAYLVPAAGGPARPVGGAADRETIAIGWTPGGKAVVGFWEGGCGAGTDSPGTYVVDPGTGRRRRIHPYSSGALLTPVRGYFANRLERIMQRAHQELALPECCGQPTHGGEDAEDGFTFEGHDIGVYAAPLNDLPTRRPARPDELRFDCGTARYYLTDFGPSSSATSRRPDPALLTRAVARLVSGLYCTAGPTETTTSTP